MYWLESLVIHAYRTLPNGTTLGFSDGANVLLGTNGSGKTTLLNLIDMIVRSDFSSLATDNDSIDIEFTTAASSRIGPVPTIFRTTIRLRLHPSTISGTPNGPLKWRVSGRFWQNDATEFALTFDYASTGDSSFDPALGPPGPRQCAA